MIAHWGVPAAYNYWAILGLDIFFVVMWLCSFALLASRVAASYSYLDSYSYSSYYRAYYGVSSETDVLLATQAAAAGLGGVELYGPFLRSCFHQPFPLLGPGISLLRQKLTYLPPASCTSSPS
jgi:hypothetical protein